MAVTEIAPSFSPFVGAGRLSCTGATHRIVERSKAFSSHPSLAEFETEKRLNSFYQKPF
jgi:hypothetical protein